MNIKGFAEKFEDYMARGYYSLSTPVWINFGKQKGLPISCYGSNIDDNLDSILNAGREIGMMSKYGGGTSAYLGNIRPRGSVISTGGFADGPIHSATAELYVTSYIPSLVRAKVNSLPVVFSNTVATGAAFPD